MKDLSRGLLLRLALALAESKPPVPSKPAKSERTGEQPEALSEAAWKRLEGLRTRFESELGFADTWLADDPPSSRVEMLLANSSELRKLAILQRFIERAYSFRLDQPREGLQVADNVIAWTKANPSSLLSVIRGRAWMERGNFLRILGDPEGAYAAACASSPGA